MSSLELDLRSVKGFLVADVRGRVIGLYQMGALGLRAFSGVTIGIVGGLIGVHWSLALSAMMLLTVITGLLAFTLRSADREGKRG